MSEENAELVAEDCVWDWSNSIGPAKGVYRGKEQQREFWASFVEVDSTLARLRTIADGEVQGVKLYQSKAEALEAVALQ